MRGPMFCRPRPRRLDLLVVFLTLGVGAFSVGACEDQPSGSTGAAPSATATVAASQADTLAPRKPTGVKDCDAYFEAAVACYPKADDDLRKELRESLARYDNQLEQASSDVAKRAVGVGCAAALESLKEEPACR